MLGACAMYSAAVQAEWVYREEAIMGTRCAVELWATDRNAGNAAIEAVLADMRRIDALMSTYKPDSEISRVNDKAALAPVAVTAELFGLLQTAQQYSGLSKGVFDITYASVGYLYDYRQHLRPDDKTLAGALIAVDYRQLKLDPHRRFRQAWYAYRSGGYRQGLCRRSGYRDAQGARLYPRHGQCRR
jgi:thiamine biosynthesis lipoprotein